MRRLIFLIFVVCALTACTERVEYPAEFAVADSLADHNEPQRALALLDSLTGTSLSWPEAVRMRYALLKYKAADKSYVPITSDSTILPILRYYERTQEEWLPEAYYYTARTYTDLGDAPRALDYFQQAATLMEGDRRWSASLSRVYAQMASLFSYQWMTSESVHCYEKSAAISLQIGDSSSLVSTYSNIAANFSYENWDSVAYYIDKASSIAEACRDTIWYYQLLKTKANAYVSLGNFEEARLYLHRCFERQDWYSFEGCWTIAAALFDSLGRTDTMTYCLKQAFINGNIYAKKNSSKRLADLYAANGKSDSSRYYLSECLYFTDSIEHMNDAQLLQKMESSYNYNIYVRENDILRQKEQEERAGKRLYQMTALFVILFAGGVLFYLYKRYKWQKCRSRAQLASLKVVTSERISSLEKKLQEQENQYLLRNDSLQHEIELTRSELEALRQQQKTKISQLELERSKLKTTAMYDSLCKDSKISDAQIKAIREYYEQNNPQFLEALVSLCNLSKEEWIVTLLVRMGIDQTQISKLLCRTPATIHCIRKKIVCRVKGADVRAIEWNRIIESL